MEKQVISGQKVFSFTVDAEFAIVVNSYFGRGELVKRIHRAVHDDLVGQGAEYATIKVVATPAEVQNIPDRTLYNVRVTASIASLGTMFIDIEFDITEEPVA